MRVFLSHAREDASKAARLKEALERAGIEVWSADEQLKPGDLWLKSIGDAISSADAVLILLSRGAEDSPEITTEVAMALASQEDAPKRVIPVVTERGVELPFFLRQLAYLDLSDESNFHRALEQLVETLQSQEARGPELSDTFTTLERARRAQREVISAAERDLWDKSARITSSLGGFATLALGFIAVSTLVASLIALALAIEGR
jgi:hypothetical protein